MCFSHSQHLLLRSCDGAIIRPTFEPDPLGSFDFSMMIMFKVKAPIVIIWV